MQIRNAGRGVFLKKAASKGTVIGFYNGVRMSDMQSRLRKADRKSAYRMDNHWAKDKEVTKRMNIKSGKLEENSSMQQ